MKEVYGKYSDWTESNYKKSFDNLQNDGFDYEGIDVKDWFLYKMDSWKTAVICQKIAKRVVDETEKALKYEIVNQYGNVYTMWFPKSVIL